MVGGYTALHPYTGLEGVGGQALETQIGLKVSYSKLCRRVAGSDSQITSRAVLWPGVEVPSRSCHTGMA